MEFPTQFGPPSKSYLFSNFPGKHLTGSLKVVDMTAGNSQPVVTHEKCRKGLPMVFNLSNGHQTVMTGYDTGTQANHMSLKLAKEMGLKVHSEGENKSKFRLANGKVVESIGRVTASVTFANGSSADGQGSISCSFNIFKTLAVPAIMGMAFLEATKTLSRFTSRLVNLPQDFRRALRICAVGDAQNEVVCTIAGEPVVARADTGSEIALVSEKFARQRRFSLQSGCEELMFADGTKGYTTGCVDLDFRLGHVEDGDALSLSKRVRFHVLRNLQFDVLLDEDLVNDFKVFQEGSSELVSNIRELIPSLAPIIHLSSIEKAISNGGRRLKGWMLSMVGREQESEPAVANGDGKCLRF